MYSETTDAITVFVDPEYLDDQSDPGRGRWVWAYHIRIENHGAETVKLLSRYWRITDAQGRIQEVQGEGVVGEQPVLEPGEAYEYSSGTPLGTPSGFMVGTYEMETDAGRRISVKVPAFSLDCDDEAETLH